MKMHTVVPALLSAALVVLLPAAAGAGSETGASVRSTSGGVVMDDQSVAEMPPDR